MTPSEAATMAHMHGFHSYPARLHPQTAGRLITGLSAVGGRVFDPFCGSGTVPLEALCAGRRVFGTDANPFAIELSWLKTLRTTAPFRSSLLAASVAAAETADARRLSKAGPTHRYGTADRELFPIHVLLELDGLAAAISSLTDEKLRRCLMLVLSSILTKVSCRPGDSTTRLEPRRSPGGATVKLFVAKTRELARRLGEFAEKLPAKVEAPKLAVADARRPGPMRAGSVDLIVTSPPYPGVFDYFDHHADRLRWLKLPTGGFRSNEIGSRRAFSVETPALALTAWQRDFGECLVECRRVLGRQGLLVLVVADSVVAGRALFADQYVSQLAQQVGFSLVTAAAQERPHFHAPTARAFKKTPRREHVLVLGKS